MVTALAERGISLAGVAPKPITTELLANADLVVTMSRHPTGPEAMRTFCDQVDGRGQALLAGLPHPVQTAIRAAVWHSRSFGLSNYILGFSGSVTA